MERTAYRTLEQDGLRLFYREAGPKDAPALLLLHGFLSSSHMFRDLIPLLADDLHLIAPDYPGFGYSSAPSVTEFNYTFDHLTDVVERFVQDLGLSKFSIYMQDYGGPVGFRLASRHPEWVEALVIQNDNAYEEGVTETFRKLLGPLWENRTGATEKPVLDLFELEGTKFQYQHGARNPDGMNPDAWTHDQYGLDRPGNKLIQLDLQANYYTNLSQYDTWHAYFRKHQPPTLVVWGEGDPLFGVEGAKAYKRDLNDIEVHLLNTGHFALEEDAEIIAGHIQRFLKAKVRRDRAPDFHAPMPRASLER